MLRKLNLEDLKIGMQVEIEQLSDIYDTLIMVQMEEMTSKSGTIRFIGKGPCAESQSIYNEGKPVAPIFHDSIELEEDIVFDE